MSVYHNGTHPILSPVHLFRLLRSCLHLTFSHLWRSFLALLLAVTLAVAVRRFLRVAALAGYPS